nr:TIGR03619 family F420-dependent LLM class oxidoreductase [Kibdelosporangium sp. MJ126-NF4]CEL22943.1 luciferase-like protein [Kibdelosporangium sp. MJ126-NF4]CTQ90082.1 luciferase-like protein [Kibdelosporangium sp. MJ126-NF4]
MDLHAVLPDESPAMPVQRLAELAATAEHLGYRAVWLPDHLLPPSDYGNVYGGVYEPLVTLSYLAAHTRTVRLGTSVLVLPMRNPFVVAKQAATLDHISGGRFVLGVGIGWARPEFDAVGADYRTRAARTDEAIALIRHLFESDGAFEGAYYGYETGVFQPRPEHGVPIMVGGNTDAALRRVAALADEWQALSLTPEQFAERLTHLRSLTSREIRATVRIAWDGEGPGLDDVLGQTRGLTEAGADAVAVWFGAETGFEDRMTRFAEKAL